MDSLRMTTSNSLSLSGLTAPSGGLRVLLVDDDRKLCRLIAEYLSPMGYQVSSVHTGPEGVQSAQAERWDAVMLDLMLPGMDGFEVLKQIRRFSEVPVWVFAIVKTCVEACRGRVMARNRSRSGLEVTLHLPVAG